MNYHWNQISEQISYYKLTGEKNTKLSHLLELLEYWFPTFEENFYVCVNYQKSFHYDSNNKMLSINYFNVAKTFEKFYLSSNTIEALVKWYLLDMFDISILFVRYTYGAGMENIILHNILLPYKTIPFYDILE
jgi:hypothetical protein